MYFLIGIHFGMGVAFFVELLLKFIVNRLPQFFFWEGVDILNYKKKKVILFLLSSLNKDFIKTNLISITH